MIQFGLCPVCGSDSWKRVGQQRYTPENISGSSFLEKRRRVLFEVWLPKAREFLIHFELCRKCGFVCYFPRPTAQDLDDKYRFLARVYADDRERAQASRGDSTDEGLHEPPSRQKSLLGEKRGKQVFDAVEPFLKDHSELMDFGGGRGDLLRSFVDRGVSCGVVDYMNTVPSDIKWLGSTLQELPPGRAFDIIVCSHVIEHLAEPVALARELYAFLRTDGLIFVEVPLELRGGPPRRKEPVTHINFFCPSSLSTLLESAGYEVLTCQRVDSVFENGRTREAVRAVARRGRVPNAVRLPSNAEALSLLKEGVKSPSLASLRRIYGAGRDLVRARFSR